MPGQFPFPPLVRGGRRSVEDLGFYLLPQEFIPRNATFLDRTVEQVIGFASTVTVLDYKTPANRRGVIRRLAVDTADPAGLPNITFSVLRSGAPVENYQGVQAPLGSVHEPDTVFVNMDREQNLQISVTNLDPVFNWDVHVRVVAWFWDIQVEAGR